MSVGTYPRGPHFLTEKQEGVIAELETLFNTGDCTESLRKLFRKINRFKDTGMQFGSLVFTIAFGLVLWATIRMAMGSDENIVGACFLGMLWGSFAGLFVFLVSQIPLEIIRENLKSQGAREILGEYIYKQAAPLLKNL